MVNFVFTDTIPSSFAAMNEITFSPAYAIRSGWTVAFRFPSFASGESKTLVYSVDKWVGSSKLADFGVYAMSCNVQVSAPPIEPVVTTPVANVSVVKPKPAVPVLQPAVPQPAPVGSSNSLYSAFLAFPWWIVVLFLCIGVLGVTGYWYMSQGNNKKKSAR